MTLRRVLMVFGALLLPAALTALLLGQMVPGIWLAACGVALTVGIACERWRYKGNDARLPATTFKPTGERFVDPGTGQLVEVYYDQASGRRSYLDTSTR